MLDIVNRRPRTEHELEILGRSEPWPVIDHPDQSLIFTLISVFKRALSGKAKFEKNDYKSNPPPQLW